MKRFIWMLFSLMALSYAQEFCVKEKEGAFVDDPYIKAYTIRAVQDALIEANNRIDCADKSSKTIILKITNFSSMPIGYSIYQRANNYILNIGIELDMDGQKHVYTQSSYYALPSGSEGDIPKRQAFEDAINRIKDNIVSDFIKK